MVIVETSYRARKRRAEGKEERFVFLDSRFDAGCIDEHDPEDPDGETLIRVIRLFRLNDRLWLRLRYGTKHAHPSMHLLEYYGDNNEGVRVYECDGYQECVQEKYTKKELRRRLESIIDDADEQQRRIDDNVNAKKPARQAYLEPQKLDDSSLFLEKQGPIQAYEGEFKIRLLEISDDRTWLRLHARNTIGRSTMDKHQGCLDSTVIGREYTTIRVDLLPLPPE